MTNTHKECRYESCIWQEERDGGRGNIQTRKREKVVGAIHMNEREKRR